METVQGSFYVWLWLINNWFMIIMCPLSYGCTREVAMKEFVHIRVEEGSIRVEEGSNQFF